MEGDKLGKKLVDKKTQSIAPKEEMVKNYNISQKEIAKEKQNEPKSNQAFSDGRRQGKSYEVRTMQHDIAQMKGKTVQPISISSSRSFEEKMGLARQEGTSQQARSKEEEKKKFFSREGSVSQIVQKSRFSWGDFLNKIRSFHFKSQSSGSHLNPRLALFMVAVIFIGGIGYYLYTSGAFSALSGVFHHSSIQPQPQPQPPVASKKPTTTPAISSSTPAVSTSSLASNIQISPSFFAPDEQVVIKINSLSDLKPALEQNFNKPLKEDSFRRIVVMLHNSLSSLSLAQIFSTLKQIALGKAGQYRELISDELIDSWGLSMPGDVYRDIAKGYNLFFYGQPGDGGRIVVIFKVNNVDQTSQDLNNWEQTMMYDLEEFFLGVKHGDPFTDVFVDNYHKNIHIRYLNLPRPDITLDYALLPQEKYLIFTTSRESMWAAIDKIVGETNSQTDTTRQNNENSSSTVPVSTSSTSTP